MAPRSPISPTILTLDYSLHLSTQQAINGMLLAVLDSLVGSLSLNALQSFCATH